MTINENSPHLSEAQLNEYLDNALPNAQRAAVDQHLNACANCRAKLEALQVIFASLAALPEEALRRDLSSRVMEAIQPKLAPARALHWGLVAQAISAVIALIWGWLTLDPAIHWPVVAPLTVLASQVSLSWSRLLGFDLLLPRVPLPAPHLSLPLSAVWLLLISAGLLWLAGNFILLRPRPRRR